MALLQVVGQRLERSGIGRSFGACRTVRQEGECEDQKRARTEDMNHDDLSVLPGRIGRPVILAAHAAMPTLGPAALDAARAPRPQSRLPRQRPDAAMTQNVYDREDFFAAYGTLPRSVEGLDGAPEWPAFRALLPPLEGLRVLDLGCGFGWYARFVRQRGAASVLGLDVSERMLERARAMTDDPAIAYRRADLETATLPEGAFDLALSVLALHYIADLGRLLAEVRRSLVPGGRLVVHMEHPIFMAPSRPDFATDGEGRRIWPLDRYMVEGPRVTDWLAPGVEKHHRPLSRTLNLLIDAGFTLDRVEEWRPDAAQLALHPDWATELDRPMFLFLAAHRA